MKNKALHAFVSILLMAFSALAQVSEKEKAEKDRERAQQLERNTTILVEEIANTAWSLKLPENRSYILTTSADLLWTRDEKRARNLFWDAINTRALTTKPATPEPKGAAVDQKKVQNEYFANYSWRQQFLRIVARRDPNLALDMLRVTRQPLLETGNDQFRLPDDRDLEQQISMEAAARDPERALQIARASLARGLSFDLLNLLYNLSQKDSEVATKFAGEVIDKIRTQNLSRDLFAPSIAAYMLRMSRTRGEALLASEERRGQWKVLSLTDEQKRDLVLMLCEAALTPSTNANLLYVISEVKPEIEQFAPDRLPQIQQKLAAFELTLNREQKSSNRYNSFIRDGAFEPMIKAAATANENDREMLYQQAVVIAVMRGKADSLRDLIRKEVADESRRKSLLDSVDSEQIGLAAMKGRPEELREVLPLIRLKEQRGRAMAELAVQLEKNGEHDEALKLVEEARVLIKIDLDSPTQTDALFTLLYAYSLIEPDKAFAIVEKVVDRANDQISKLLLLDKIIRTGIVKKGELRLEQPGMMPLDFMVFKYGKGVAALAKADFNRTKAVADRFQRNELRLLARLLMAQTLAREEQQPVESKPPTSPQP